MWARIDNGVVAEITNIDPNGRFHPSIVWVPCQIGTTIGEIYSNGNFSVPQQTPAQLLSAYQQSAKDALSSTSITMERILEAVIAGRTSFASADVIAWVAYRSALRSQISATVIGTLPIKPPYPAGT